MNLAKTFTLAALVFTLSAPGFARNTLEVIGATSEVIGTTSPETTLDVSQYNEDTPKTLLVSYGWMEGSFAKETAVLINNIVAQCISERAAHNAKLATASSKIILASCKPIKIIVNIGQKTYEVYTLAGTVILGGTINKDLSTEGAATALNELTGLPVTLR